MSHSISHDIARLINERMATGKYASEDELLREALEALSAEEDDLQAIQKAIDKLQAGDPEVPMDEAIASIQDKRTTA